MQTIQRTNHKSKQIHVQCIRCQAQGNACEQVTIAFGFTSNWLRKWWEIFFTQSQSVAMQNQSNCKIIFDTQLKNALKGYVSELQHGLMLQQICSWSTTFTH